MKAIIFGINGQDGYFLKVLLEKRGIEVIGVSRHNTPILGDVGQGDFVDHLLKHHKPDFVFHFAANSTTRHDALMDNHAAISSGTLHILESARLHCPESRIFLSGSAMQFKNENQPIDESTPFDASSPYALARIHSIFAGRYYRQTFGMKIYAGYFFNHDSSRRTEKHINQKIVASLKRILEGSKESLELGDIEVRKEFNFAGDVVEAVWNLVSQDKVYEAVIGCGIDHSIKEWVEYCFGRRGLDWKDHVVPKANFTPEYKILVSRPTLIKSLGWEPRVGFKQLADLMMENL